MKNIISIIIVLTAFNVAFAGQSTDSSGIITKNGYPDRVVRPFPTKRGPQNCNFFTIIQNRNAIL